jgi:hypothetical protein
MAKRPSRLAADCSPLRFEASGRCREMPW